MYTAFALVYSQNDCTPPVYIHETCDGVYEMDSLFQTEPKHFFQSVPIAPFCGAEAKKYEYILCTQKRHAERDVL